MKQYIQHNVNVYGAVIMTTATVRVHLDQMKNKDSFLDQTNLFRL